MTADDRDERSVLAAEYVLGTLELQERTAAEERVARDSAFRGEVWSWEERLAGIGLRLRPVMPPPVAWLGIQRRIEPRGAVALRRGNRLVGAWALLATAASVLLGAVLLLRLAAPPPAPDVVAQRVEVPIPAVSYVAVLQMPGTTMQWSVSATPERGEIVLRATGEAPAVAAGREPELWLITDAGPRSLGLMPMQGEMRRALDPSLPLASGRTLAVSLEPPGGSRTGAPTGPVVTSGAMLQAG